MGNEEAILREVLADPLANTHAAFTDDLYARVAHTCRDNSTNSLDLAVLIRHVLRRWSVRSERNIRAVVAPSISERLRTHSSTARLHEVESNTWFATPWQPAWLDSTGKPDSAAIAGPPARPRFTSVDLTADPFFQNITGHPTYRTPGQRAACRAVVSVPVGHTVIAMLPTGSGKTEVALCLAQRSKHTVCLVVVPTTALAYDFERRFREHYARLNPRARTAEMFFAWTADTPPDLRERLRTAVREGRQPILVTSPESISRSLRNTLLEAAATGRLGSLVVDEAHLVTQWGRSFRPEFRTLDHFRMDLIREAERSGYNPLTTLLLSATLGPHELTDLHRLFGEPGPSTLIAANALRPEPDLWIATAEDKDERERRVLEALANLPRPAILYVTTPEAAVDWHRRLEQAGYGRLGLVTGRTSTDSRTLVLKALRSTAEEPAAIDLVVATSAFGLGIDYAHIRTVVHACLPETVDRWYQELGRGGRDGHASAAFLLTAPPDVAEAERLTTKVLTAETAQERWTHLWRHRKTLRDQTYVDIEDSRGSTSPGSYNRRWNAQLVQGLVEQGALRRHQVDIEDVIELNGDDEDPHDWVSVEVRRPDLSDSTFWNSNWTPWQKAEWSRSRTALDAIRRVAAGSISACEVISECYRPDDTVRDLFGRAARYIEPEGQCGRCPGCRRRGYGPPHDPPPMPPQLWPLIKDHEVDLDDLIEASGVSNGLILLIADTFDTIAPSLAKVLVKRGIRHLAGPMGAPVTGVDWLFVDQLPVAPSNLTPYSSFVVYPAGHRIPSSWLMPRIRLANRTSTSVDIVLTTSDALVGNRHVVRDLRAFDAHTALQILEG